MINYFHRGFGTFQSFINSNEETWNHEKCRKRELLIQPYLRERKREHGCGVEKERQKENKNKKRETFKDDIRRLNGLKIKRKSMQN